MGERGRLSSLFHPSLVVELPEDLVEDLTISLTERVHPTVEFLVLPAFDEKDLHYFVLWNVDQADVSL